MTKEEAAAILAESKRQNEVMRDNPHSFFSAEDFEIGPKNAQKRIDALDMAISGLREDEATREFYVETPLGRLKVWAKHKTGDNLADYPGVYIDLVKEGEPDTCLACIEYDSCGGELQADVYGIVSNDDPTNIIVFGDEYRDKTDV